MYHFSEAITNIKGDSLVGYFVRAINTTTGDVITMSSDAGGTAIETVSGVANMCKTDNTGMAFFYVPFGGYHLDIYAPDAVTFIRRIPDIDMGEATALAQSASDSAAADRLQTGLDAAATAADRIQTTADAATTTLKSGQAQAAALAARAYPNSAASAVPKGVTGTTGLTAGSGGTNGTFALAFTGGGGSGASGTFTVTGGALVSATITAPGYGYTSAPTISLAASSGLTGASLTAVVGFLESANYWVASSDAKTLDLYSNVGGTATLVYPAVSMPQPAYLADLFAPFTALGEIGRTGTAASNGTAELVTSAGTGLTVFGPKATAICFLKEISTWIPTLGTGVLNLVVMRFVSGASYQVIASYALPNATATGKNTWTNAQFGDVPLAINDFVGLTMSNGGPTSSYASSTGDNVLYKTAHVNGGDTTTFTQLSNNALRIEAVFGAQVTQVSYSLLSPEVQGMLGIAAQISALPIALPSGSVPVPTARMAFTVTGQSNAESAQAYPPISTSQIFSNVMTTGGVRTPGPSNGGSVVTTTVPLIENTTAGASGTSTSGETICSGANYATQLRLAKKGGAASDVSWHATNEGWTGMVIENLRKGQARYGLVTDHLQQVYAAATAASLPLSFAAQAFIQGESNTITTNPGESNTRSGYLAQILAYFAEVRADMKAKSGQSWNPHTGMFQVPYATRTGVNPGAIQLAQYDAVNQDPLCHFVMPLYFLSTVNPGSDNTHYPNVMQHIMGLYWGRWLYQLVQEQRVPDCVWPISVTAKGQTVLIKFRTPSPLTLDNLTMFPATDYGFKITDGSGTLTLSNIQIVGSDSVQITINRALSGAWKVRYALDYAGTGQSGIGYACGNLRDTTADTWTYLGSPHQLFHAAPQFEMAGVSLDSSIT